jgi:hypothetical protein
MKRLVLCFDGTWNAVADPKTVTNVVRLANMVTVSTADGIDQVSYYNSGVGSGGLIDQFLGGAFGVGLKSNVKRGLTFLALNYEDGDEIYLFGFSRGAYTARALAGVIGAAGIPLDISETERHWELYQNLAKLLPKQRWLSQKGDSPELQAVVEKLDEVYTKLRGLSRNEGKNVPIKCIGVWDTVGAYGVPMGFGLSSLSRAFTYWTRGFRNRGIGQSVAFGFHAIAIDEMRRPFSPTFWMLREGQKLEEAQDVEQMWFAGVHSNIGGSYDNTGLSDMALAWMVARVAEKTGLEFNPSTVLEDVWPCSACTLYRSGYGWPIGRSRIALPVHSTSLAARAWRGIKRFLFKARRRHIEFDRVNEQVHWSVQERCALPVTLVDGRKPGKYRPASIRSAPKAYSNMLDLERLLVDRNHVPAELPPGLRNYTDEFDLAEALRKRNADWDNHCTMHLQAKLECQCKLRYGAPSESATPRAAA